jgi:hypothetical protein
MQKYEAVRVAPPDEHEKHVLVTTKRCRYRVCFTSEQVQLFGPGVNEEADRAELEFDSIEDAGIYYVLLFESGLWPE